MAKKARKNCKPQVNVGDVVWCKCRGGAQPVKVVDAIGDSDRGRRLRVSFLLSDSKAEKWVLQASILADRTPPTEDQQRRARSHTIDVFHRDRPSHQRSETPGERNINNVFVRDSRCTAWFASPIPQFEGTLMASAFVCDGCCRFFRSQFALEAHEGSCGNRLQPLGDEMYRDVTRRLVVCEVDGRLNLNVEYCQRIGLLTKLFLDHKMTLADVHCFSFFVLLEVDEDGLHHFAGYFSKEWNIEGTCENNLSCIMVLPMYQTRGYGRFLMKLSYLLSRREGVLGTPERPLSDLGERSYFSLWTEMVCDALSKFNSVVSINDIASATGMTQEDVYFTLHFMRALRVAPGKQLSIIYSDEQQESAARRARRPAIPLEEHLLRWSPVQLK